MTDQLKFIDVNDLNFDEEFIDSLIEHLDQLKHCTIDEAGGIDKAKDLIKNVPEGCNAYDIMYKEYSFIESWFMVDHSLTINLDDLKDALDEL